MVKLMLLAVTTLAIGQVSAKTVEDVCPKYLVDRVNDRFLKVYQGSCFYFSLNWRKTYFDARDQCKRYGGSLAIVNNEDLNNFLVHVLRKELWYSRYVWIGLNDVEDEGNYVWEDGTRVEWENFDWLMGWDWEEDCIAIEPYTGIWHDTECEEFDWLSFAPGKYAYICQFTSATDEPKQRETIDLGDGGENKEENKNKTNESRKDKNEDDINSSLAEDTIKENPEDTKSENKDGAQKPEKVIVQTTLASAVDDDPKQGEDDPKQSEGEPKQGEDDPKQGEGEPKQGEDDPKQSEGEPKQGEGEPKQGEDEPKQGEGEPKQGEGEPKQGEDEPKQGEDEPKQGEGEPKQGEDEPKQGEGEPKQGEDEPKQDHDKNVEEDEDKPIDDSNENNEDDDTERVASRCPPFKCTIDCGMDGYTLDANQCQICECNQ